MYRLFSFLTVSILLLASACSRPDKEEKGMQPASPDFFTELRSVSKINFATMTVTKSITTERTKWYKIGKRIGVYSYDAYLRGYIDMNELRPEDISVNEEKRSVEVRLPAIRTEVAGRSPELRKEYEHIDFFRSRPDSRERAELKEMANEDFLREVKQNSELTEALARTTRHKAEAYFSALIEARGYSPVISFKND